MQTVVLDHLALQDGMRLLDLGCGAGRHMHQSYYGKAQIGSLGIDLGFDDVVRTRKGFEAAPDMDPHTRRWFGLAVADGGTLPFADKSFDAVICSEVLEHIPAYRGTIAEIARVIKPGGRLGVSVPRYFPEWICWTLAPGYHQTPGGHIRIFKERGLRADIESTGFRFLRRHWAHGLHSPYWWLQCLLWKRRETSWSVRQYRRFLEWDILQKPLLTRVLAAAADPIMGKSVVLYFERA